MGIYINLLLIAICAVCVIDISGFVEEIEAYLTKLFKSPLPLHIPKPISCSLCTTHWIGLIWLIASGNWTLLTYAALLLISVATPVINDIIHLVLDGITKLICVISKALHL